MTLRPVTITARASVGATVVVAVALAAAALGLGLLVRSRLTEAAVATAELRARDLGTLAESGRLPGRLSSPGEETGVAQVVTADGVVIATTANLEGDAPIGESTPATGRTTARVVGSLPIADDSRFVVVATGADTPSGPVTVYAAASLAAADRTMAAVAAALVTGYVVLLTVVALVTRRAVHTALRPVEHIRVQVADIGEHALDLRVPTTGAGDEIDRLAHTMNAMLDRLERSSERQRHFVADASHELRSPLASLRTILEVAHAHPEGTTIETVTGEALVDAGRLEALTTDLLTLARLDDPRGRASGREVDLHHLCREVARGRTPPVEVGGTEAVVTGDPLSLRRAVTNLADNAARHARSRVQIETGVQGPTVLVHVDDDGPGVPPEDRERIFERFTRLDDARSRDRGGTGLGLAIVAELADTLGGRVSVRTSALGGARFTLELPASPPEGVG